MDIMKFKNFFKSATTKQPPSNQTDTQKTVAKSPSIEDQWASFMQVKSPAVASPTTITNKIDRNLSFPERSKQSWPHFTKGFSELAANWLRISGLVLSNDPAAQNSNYEKIKNNSFAKKDYEPFYNAFYKAVAHVTNRMTPAVATGSKIEQAAINGVNQIAKNIGLID